MYELLSDREGAKSSAVRYSSPSDTCRNRLTSLISDVFWYVDERGDFLDDFYRETVLHLGTTPCGSSLHRSRDDLVKLAAKFDDSEFLDFVDLAIQTIKENAGIEGYYEEFAADVNRILKKDGMGYRAESGRLIKIPDEKC